MKTYEVCACLVRRVCSPCQSLITWLPSFGCAGLMKLIPSSTSSSTNASYRLLIVGICGSSLESAFSADSCVIIVVRLSCSTLVVSSEGLRSWFSVKVHRVHTHFLIRVGRQTNSFRDKLADFVCMLHYSFYFGLCLRDSSCVCFS